jgi:hypothetical protein
MIKLIAIAGLAFAITTSGQAMTRAPHLQPDSLVTPVIAGCGVGQTMVNGKCETRVEKRHNRRCLRWSGKTCEEFAK